MTWARKLTVKDARRVADAILEDPSRTLRSACAAAGVVAPRLIECLRRVEEETRNPSETDYAIYAVVTEALERHFDELRREALLTTDAVEGVKPKHAYHAWLRHLLETQDKSHRAVSRTEMSGPDETKLGDQFGEKLSMDQIKARIQADLAKAGAGGSEVSGSDG